MFSFKKKNDSSEFFDLFVESARYFNKGALLMDDVMIDHSKAEVKVKEIQDLEHAADKINDKIIDKLNLTFITPIDREDIYSLANGLDDGVDYLQGTLQRIVMYHTGEPREKDPIELIKWKDILEYLEDTTDHCERIADLIRGVVMKYA